MSTNEKKQKGTSKNDKLRAQRDRALLLGAMLAMCLMEDFSTTDLEDRAIEDFGLLIDDIAEEENWGDAKEREYKSYITGDE